MARIACPAAELVLAIADLVDPCSGAHMVSLRLQISQSLACHVDPRWQSVNDTIYPQ